LQHVYVVFHDCWLRLHRFETFPQAPKSPSLC
jgi:hypothetical protein